MSAMAPTLGRSAIAHVAVAVVPVLVRVLIGSDGQVKRVTVTRGLPDGLDEQAIQAAYQLRFKPAMKSGQPVSFWKPVAIEFNLR